jgi:predicted transcriptional regulator
LSAVIITEGGRPDQETIAKANEEGVTLLSTEKSTFYVAGRLWELGLREVAPEGVEDRAAEQ